MSLFAIFPQKICEAIAGKDKWDPGKVTVKGSGRAVSIVLFSAWCHRSDDSKDAGGPDCFSSLKVKSWYIALPEWAIIALFLALGIPFLTFLFFLFIN